MWRSVEWPPLSLLHRSEENVPSEDWTKKKSSIILGRRSKPLIEPGHKPVFVVRDKTMTETDTSSDSWCLTFSQPTAKRHNYQGERKTTRHIPISGDDAFGQKLQSTSRTWYQWYLHFYSACVHSKLTVYDTFYCWGPDKSGGKLKLNFNRESWCLEGWTVLAILRRTRLTMGGRTGFVCLRDKKKIRYHFTRSRLTKRQGGVGEGVDKGIYITSERE